MHTPSSPSCGQAPAVRSLAQRVGRWAALPTVAVLLAVAITASFSSSATYRVRPGDTLSAIASRYHTTVAALVRLNNLPGNGNLIYAGSVLRLPGHHSQGHAGHAAVRHGTYRVWRPYLVKPGDSLYAIAARFHANPRVIARHNHLPSSLIVILGQRLAIPHRVHVGGGPDPFRGVYVPSRTTVAAMIRSTALHWGVDPRFALGISYEESGFNQRVISKVGAIGAMQVMPGTGAWVAASVLHRPINLYRAHDDVAAGVALLAVLLRETHGNERLAAAGYYQGLSSVRTRGMFRDTKQYVANVLALRNRF
jgi:LysM repeat protein